MQIELTLENVKDIILILTPIATFLLALFTINKWKKEYRGKIYFDCSFRFLKSVYALRDQFMSMRSAFITAGEQLPREGSYDNYENENTRYYLINRAKPFQETLNVFYSNVPEVEVLLGKEVRELCQNINSVVGKYYMARNEYIQLVGITNNNEHLKEISKSVFYITDKDELGDELEKIIKKIERAVSVHLKLIN